MSYSSFSFSAAYLNPNATCYLSKNYLVNDKNYLYGNNVISPNWILIDNREYLLNFDQDLLKKIIKDYLNYCNNINQSGGKRGRKPAPMSNLSITDNNIIKIKNKSLNTFSRYGPLEIYDSDIQSKLIIYGTINFKDLVVNGISKIYGTVYGRNGNLYKLNVYGDINIQDSEINNLELYGNLNADNINIENEAFIAGKIYVSNSTFNKINIVSNIIRFDDSYIDELIIINDNNKLKIMLGESNDKNIVIKSKPKKIILNKTNVNKLVVKGEPLKISISFDSKIIKSINANIVIDKDL
jgi:hypothetical protein